MIKRSNEIAQYVGVLVDQFQPTLELPDPNLVQYYEDCVDRNYWILGEVNDELLDLVNKIIAWNREDERAGRAVEDRKPIRIFFNSPGGDLDVEETLVSMIRLSKTPVYGIALGMTASAASLIYLSCHKKFALPNAYFVLHKGSCSNIGGNYNDVAAMMKDYDQQIEKMMNFYIENTDYSEDEIKKNMDKDWYIRLPEAKDRGLVDEVISDISIML